ncbi:hypothetical protein FCMLKIFP_00017 [Pseudomonas phage Ka3]|uniref:Uncharacterized protein n=1 Tax=Pseudomonas phage KPP21 TaxID=1678082 RepID=A0A0H5BIB0_BPK21|nr:hypothetical protein AVU12_gp110 [Pseudomonas phage KPP21]QWY17811.1 hypothetical protein [Pseudomonas phage vB_Pae-PA152]WQZ52367.1 hypothetical protein FCMLKIFP_00017 [Pseudomonas phage Ka3]BAR94669.1 hypothetical protein [Pseudomonas phage KPP21]
MKKNRYLLSFVTHTGGGLQFTSTVYSAKDVVIGFTAPLIAEIKVKGGVHQDAILLAVSELGLSTDAEFNPPYRPGMDATAAYLHGVRVGLLGEQGDNPYPENSVDAVDFRNGRIAGSSMRENQDPPQDLSPQ